MSQETNERIPIKRKGRFWKVVALAALLLCGWMATERGGREARADNGGATTKGFIVMMGVNSLDERLYLLDTNSETMLVYETGAGGQTKLVSSRSFNKDLGFVASVPGKFLKYNGKGYETEVAEYVKRVEAEKKP